MSSDSSVLINKDASPLPGDYRWRAGLSWPAVLAGTVAAIGIYWLLTILGAGAGLEIFGPRTVAEPVVAFSTGIALVWSLFTLLALALGGWVAGYCAGDPRDGWLHGVLVWCLALLLVLPALTLGTFFARGRTGEMPVETSGLSQQTVVRAEQDLAATVARRNLDELGSFAEEAVQSIPTNAAPKASTRAQREIGLAVTTLFAPGNAAGFQTNRDEAIKALMVYTEMSAAEATTTVYDWTLSEQKLQYELARLAAGVNQLRTEWINLNLAREENASAAAAQRAHRLARVGRWSFFALLIGLLGAFLGARRGAERASRYARGPGAPASRPTA